MIPQSPSIATKESEQKDGRAAKTQMIQVSFSSSFIVLGGRWWKGIPAENKTASKSVENLMFPAEKTKARPDFELEFSQIHRMTWYIFM